MITTIPIFAFFIISTILLVPSSDPSSFLPVANAAEFSTSNEIIPDESIGTGNNELDSVSYMTDLTYEKSSNQEVILINVTVLIPENDFVKVKLINSDGGISHMLWYKVESDTLTSFTHTFTDIERLEKRGMYSLQVEYDDMVSKKTVILS